MFQELNDKIQILNGRYGLYIKCGKTNVSLPKDTDIEKFTLENALVLLEEKMRDQKSSGFKKNKVINKKISKNKKSKK